MKKFLSILSLCLILVISGCGLGERTEYGNESVVELIKKADKYNQNVSYNILSQTDDFYMFMNYKIKDDKLLCDIENQRDNKSLMIINGDYSYSFNLNDNTVTKSNYKNEYKFSTPANFTRTIDIYEVNFQGMDSLDKVNCVKALLKDPSNDDAYITAWVHPKYGFIMKLENIHQDGQVTTTQIQELVVGKVKDSDFILPDGFEVIDKTN